jgi:hypothetical protein
VTVLPHRWLLRAPGNLRARHGALLKIRAPDLSNPSKPTEKELISAKNWKILMRRNSDRPACVATRQRPKPQRSCLSCSAKPSQNPHSHSGHCLTDQSTLCYNSLTGQGQLLWVGVCLHRSFGRGLIWCPWCPFTSEIGSTGLKQATQANRLNLRKATKHAGFR